MISRLRILLEELLIKMLTMAVKMLTRLKRIVLFIISLKMKSTFSGRDL